MSPQGQPHWKKLFSASHFAIGTLLIVPNDMVRNMVGEEILTNREVVMGPRVMSFNLLEKILSGELGPAPIDGLLRLMALNAAAPDVWEPLGLPGHLEPARVIELADQLGDGLDRLRLAGVSWETLESLEPRELSAALAAIGRRYEAWLGDRDDQFSRRRKLLEALRGGHQFDALAEIESVHCHHSSRLSPFEAELLKALAAKYRVNLRLSAPRWLLEENIPPGTGYHRLRLVRDLEGSQIPGLDLTWADPQKPDRPEVPEALRYASENLFGPRPQGPAPDPTGVLSILAVPTRYHEVEEVGRKIKALLVGGIPSHRLAIAVPTLSLWLPSILDVARRFGLSLRYRRGIPLSSYPPVSALLDLVSLWDSNWELTRILKILESPYFEFGLEGLLRPFLHEIGISDERAAGGFKANFDKISDPVLREKLKPTYLAVGRLKQAAMNLSAAKTWKSFRDRLQSILRGFGWPGRVLAESQGRGYEHEFWLRTSTDSVSVERMANLLHGLFDALAASQHAPPVSLASFKLWLHRTMSETAMEEHGGSEMGVKVLNYFDLHGAFFEALFLMGLNDKVFPSAKAEGCWWPEELVQSLATTSLGRRLWSNAAENYQREEDIVAQALSQAKRVVISYQTSTEDQRPALPSAIVESLIDLWPEGVLKAERPGWPLPPPADRVCDAGELWLNLAVNHPAQSAPEIFKRLSRRPLEEAEGLWASIPTRRKSLNLLQERLSPQLLEAWLGTLPQYQGRPLATVRPLVGFAECPRRFWYQEILSVAAWPGTMETWSGWAQGEVIHQTLENFLGPLVSHETRDFGPSRLKYIYWERAHRHFCSRPVGRRPVYSAISKKLEASLMAWVERHKDLAKVKVAALEWSFGNSQGHDAPPYRVDSPSGDFFLTGRVDRIDWEGGHVVVRDYKTNRGLMYDSGGQRPKEGLRPSWHYPMILYALAAGQHFKAEPQAVIEFVDPREGEDQLGVEMGEPAEFSQLWEELMRGELGGPSDGGHCQYCQYTRLCRPRSSVGSEEA
jgi:hypothetical protein